MSIYIYIYIYVYAPTPICKRYCLRDQMLVSRIIITVYYVLHDNYCCALQYRSYQFVRWLVDIRTSWWQSFFFYLSASAWIQLGTSVMVKKK
jgi:hypothetical protein